MEEPFAPPGASWTPVSHRWISVRLISEGIFYGLLALLGLVLGTLVTWWAGTPLVVAAGLGMALSGWLIPRQVRAIGYDLGTDALTIRKGLMFRELVVVPYARMQYVDVQAGPLMRRFGVATVQLHTASASTDASIPGLDADAAARLRDELARLGETTSVGL